MSPAQSAALDLAPLRDELVERVLAGMSALELEALWYRWEFWAREEQLPPPGMWQTWLVLAGRGFGKTRCMAEWVRCEVENGRAGRVALVAATAADARDTIVEGESGILAVSPRWFKPVYEPSKRRITWPNGAIATLFSAEEPDRLRGPQHDLAWCDELAAWAALRETWDMLQMGMRLGPNPRTGIATTPRPQALLRELQADETTKSTGGNSFANRVNLAPSFLRRLKGYVGTELGRQEVDAEILDDRRGVMFSGAWFKRVPTEPSLRRVVVAIDPAISTHRHSDETGIVVAGIGYDDNAYAIADESAKLSPEGWSRRAIKAFDDHDADCFVVETNRGGDLVTSTLRAELRDLKKDPRAYPIKEVRATRGKAVRAEPIAALYEQGRVFHVGPAERFMLLEKQMIEWDPSAIAEKKAKSPDRLDALVWGLTELLSADKRAGFEGLSDANQGFGGWDSLNPV